MTGLVAAMVAGGGVVLAAALLVALAVARRPLNRVAVDGDDAEAARARSEIQSQIERGRTGTF